MKDIRFRWWKKRQIRIAGAVFLWAGFTAQMFGAVVTERTASARKRSTRKKRYTIVSKVRLHSSTPTMAWSADSRKVVYNSSFGWLDWSNYKGRIYLYKKSIGIYVFDLRKKKNIRLSRTHGFHPLWLNRHKVAWVNSSWESGPDGIFTADIRHPKKKPVRISKNGSAHHTVPSKFNDKILFWNNKSPIDFWCLFDLKTKKTISLKKMWRAQKRISTPPASPPAKKRWRSRWNLNAWKRPTGWVKSQCRQRAKKVSTHVSALRGVLVRNGNKGIVRLPGRPYRYQKGPGGLTKPCVSPNGRYVSYFVKTGVLEVVEMRVAKIR